MSNDAAVTVRGVAYGYTVEREDGFLLEAGREWSGYRIRYRGAGRRYWSSVLLIDHHHPPTVAEVAAAIAFHVHGRLDEPWSDGDA